jgi:hypothetical protein
MVDSPPGRRLRWIAEHLAATATRERVLFPLLADLQFEHAQARNRWARGFVSGRGVLAFWLAFGVTSASDTAHHLRANAWGTTPEEAEATQRLVSRIGATSALSTLALILSNWRFLTRYSAEIWVLLIPSVAMVAIPLGVLLGLALSGEDPSKGHPRGPRSVAIAAALLTFAIGAWLAPAANQRHREQVWRVVAPEFTGPLTRGDREMTLDELALRATELQSSGQGREAARFEVEWHKKLAFGASNLALALAGAAIASTLRRRLWRSMAAFAVFLVVYALLRVGEQAADLGRLVPALAMWGPFLLIAAGSLAVLALARRNRNQTLAPPSRQPTA